MLALLTLPLSAFRNHISACLHQAQTCLCTLAPLPSTIPHLQPSFSFRIALSLLGGTSDKGDVLIGTFLRFQIQLEQEARFQSMLG